MLETNKKYLGQQIISDAIGDIVRVDGTRIRIPIKKINSNSIYSFKNNGVKVVLQHHNNYWGCDYNTWDEIQKHGKEITDRMFGDLFEAIDNAMEERK